MTKRDRELLEKQLAYLGGAPGYGSLKLAVTIAALLVGLGVGSTVILHDPNATQAVASKNVVPTIMAAYEPGRRAN
jgi:hypothetical protein